MHRLTLTLVGLIALVLSACASSPVENDAAAPPPTTATPSAEATVDPVEPTPLVIPTTGIPTPTATTPPATPTATAAEPTPTTAAAAATSIPAATATPRPIPTAVVVSPTPRPVATSTPAPPRPTPTPAGRWVNPDCYVGPGAADEPVWWCGGKICVANAAHYGCPIGTPVRPAVQVSCTISKLDIVVNEIITLRAFQDPLNVSVRFAFSHGDGTIDNTSESRAYYRDPGTYNVKLLYQHSGGKGSVACGTVIVRSGSTPTPTPTPSPTPVGVQIGCTISPSRTVKVNEILTFSAFQSPANVPVSYVFDHGDGTLDATAQSQAYYAAPGSYEVRLKWTYGGQSGTLLCGTVTVRSGSTPTPTPTPVGVQIGCTISPSRTVKVNEVLTFSAFQSPANVPVSYVFDHGDGTLDATAQSQAYYAAPGFYEVRLKWASGGQSGTTLCGTVTVEANVVASDYLGRTRSSAEALANSRGLSTRVVRIDDQYFPGTTDYRLDRLNIEIDASIVTKVYIG